MSQVAAQVQRVAEARRALSEVKADIAARYEAFENSIDAIAAQQVALTQALLEEETALKALAVADFQMTGNKKPAPGVSIKEVGKLRYPKADAFAWAKEKGLAIVPESLDEKAFEKVVGALPELPTFVTREVTPRAEIASDLEKAVAA